MRRLALALTVLAGLVPALARPQQAVAPSSRLTPLETGDDSRGWDAVGRINLGTRGFCTGSLIGPSLVLTAGHCLYDKTTGKRVDPGTLEFLAGWRNGRAAAYRGIKRAVVHPDYVFSDRARIADVNYDLALLELDQPIRLPSIQPFATGAGPLGGASVGVVSYAKDRAETPSLQRACEVLGREQSVVVMSCSVDFGASGAPVFSIRDGVARVVSVISAKARMRDRPVALGIAVDGPLQTLRAELAQADASRFVRAPAAGLALGNGLHAGGAKFVRP